MTRSRLIDGRRVRLAMGSGDLYRIPKEALLQGSSPLIRKESSGASSLMQVSKNPFITTLEARMICCEHNIVPNF